MDFSAKNLIIFFDTLPYVFVFREGGQLYPILQPRDPGSKYTLCLNLFSDRESRLTRFLAYVLYDRRLESKSRCYLGFPTATQTRLIFLPRLNILRKWEDFTIRAPALPGGIYSKGGTISFLKKNFELRYSGPL